MYISERYKKRNIVATGVETLVGKSFKTYEINYADKQVNRAQFKRGIDFALSIVADKPSFIQASLGFVIKHAGNQCNYLIMVWWANENECFTEVFIDDGQNSAQSCWRTAADESFCIWDLQVIGAERNRFVKHMLCDEGEMNGAAYLADFGSFDDES